MKKSILDYLNTAARHFPDKTAYVDMTQQITYQELYGQAHRIATAVLQQESSKKTPVIVFMDKTVQAVTAFMGVACSGNIYVPFDVHAPSERLNLIMQVLNPPW